MEEYPFSLGCGPTHMQALQDTYEEGELAGQGGGAAAATNSEQW